jgi:hypothetical protein
LVFGNSGSHELHQIVIAAGNEMAFHHRVHLFDRRQKSSEIDLAMVLERDLGEDRERLPELGDVDLRRIADDVPFRLQFLDPHQAGTGREVDEFGQFHIGDAAVLLQFVKDLDVDPVEFHRRAPISRAAGRRLAE